MQHCHFFASFQINASCCIPICLFTTNSAAGSNVSSYQISPTRNPLVEYSAFTLPKYCIGLVIEQLHLTGNKDLTAEVLIAGNEKRCNNIFRVFLIKVATLL